jgi:hypothetical protein
MTTRAKRATLAIISILGLLAFASASGAYGPHLITADESTVHCKPQKNSSENLWVCWDYYGNEFKDLIILSTK